jgi:hypothetical protein
MSLAGCTTIQETFLMKYDPNEYAQITAIRTNAELAISSCDKLDDAKLNAQGLSKQTALFKNQTEFLPYNSKVIASAGELDAIAQGLVTQYQKGPVSPVFCKIKFDSIAKSAEIIQKTVGAKPR